MRNGLCVMRVGCQLLLTETAYLFHSTSQTPISPMAHWATLKQYILKRIVTIYDNTFWLDTPDDVDIYISFLQINQVCQCWRDTIKQRSIYITILVLCHNPTADQLRLYGNTSDSNQLASRGMHLTVSSPPPILWRTNIPHIVRSKNSHYTQRLTIPSRGCIIDYSSLGDILEVFGFSTVRWLRLEKICFIGDPQAAEQDPDTKTPIADDVRERLSQTSLYFITPIPHGRHLIHRASMYPVKNPPVFPLGDMLNFYLPRLQTIALSDFVLSELDHTYFSSYLARLDLHINSKSAEGFPKVFAPSLEILTLFYSDIAHLWHIFRGSLPESVIFENLTEFAIYHDPRLIGSSEEPGTYFSPISFPKLKVLTFGQSHALRYHVQIQIPTCVNIVD